MGGIFSSSAARKHATEVARQKTRRWLDDIKLALKECQAERNEAMDDIVQYSDENGHPLPGMEADYQSALTTLVILKQKIGVYVALQAKAQKDLMVHDTAGMMPEQSEDGKSNEKVMQELLARLENKQKGLASEANRSDKIDGVVSDIVDAARDSLEETHANHAIDNPMPTAAAEIVTWRKLHENGNRNGRVTTEVAIGTRRNRDKPATLGQRDTNTNKQREKNNSNDKEDESVAMYWEGVPLPPQGETSRRRKKVPQLEV